MNNPRQDLEDRLNGIQNHEPVLIGTAVVQVLTLGFALAASFGFDLTDDQQSALWGFFAALSTLIWIGATMIRNRVDSPATAARKTLQIQSLEAQRDMGGV